jgi:hypothetical protein
MDDEFRNLHDKELCGLYTHCIARIIKSRGYDGMTEYLGWREQMQTEFL